MKPFTILALACAVTLGMSTTGLAEDPAGRADTNIVPQGEIRGEVLKVDGDNYLVKDLRSNSEVKLTIEKDVMASLQHPLKEGDLIEAFVTPEGYAKTIRVAAEGKDMDKAAKELGDIQAPGGFSKEIPSGGQPSQKDQGGMKAP